MASAIDGGPSVPMQRAALEVIEPKRFARETNAVRAEFSKKTYPNALLSEKWVRFSFGTGYENCEAGLKRLLGLAEGHR